MTDIALIEAAACRAMSAGHPCGMRRFSTDSRRAVRHRPA